MCCLEEWAGSTERLADSGRGVMVGTMAAEGLWGCREGARPLEGLCVRSQSRGEVTAEWGTGQGQGSWRGKTRCSGLGL